MQNINAMNKLFNDIIDRINCNKNVFKVIFMYNEIFVIKNKVLSKLTSYIMYTTAVESYKMVRGMRLSQKTLTASLASAKLAVLLCISTAPTASSPRRRDIARAY